MATNRKVRVTNKKGGVSEPVSLGKLDVMPDKELDDYGNPIKFTDAGDEGNEEIPLSQFRDEYEEEDEEQLDEVQDKFSFFSTQRGLAMPEDNAISKVADKVVEDAIYAYFSGSITAREASARVLQIEVMTKELQTAYLETLNQYQ